MQEINIKLWRNSESQSWTIEINGLRHEHVNTEILESLVEAALIAAEEALLVAAAQRPQ
jgi:hypothetical protein